ncbi:MAG TPA: hypothetical protein O0X25_00990 [Methanocorpusculum sp.]|nr:hypothetical protein [Methanocorpusculum sp.]HJJ39864.1 hypothetical protein [Methanocorpusculum sp.]HJJ49183.1 hypothetical protein [Methanocorpusculum sp.]HJJ56841.1 hypothetical protein [Methanocorpusculum sp.]
MTPQKKQLGSTYGRTTLILCIVLAAFGLGFLIYSIVSGAETTLTVVSAVIFAVALILLLFSIVLLRRQKAMLRQYEEWNETVENLRE